MHKGNGLENILHVKEAGTGLLRRVGCLGGVPRIRRRVGGLLGVGSLLRWVARLSRVGLSRIGTSSSVRWRVVSLDLTSCLYETKTRL